jgi:hypothetical protein
VLPDPPISLVSPNYFTQVNVSCYGGTNGIINVNPGGGIPAFSYTWSPNIGTTATVSNLTPGTYAVTVTDSKGCSNSKSTVIGQPSQIQIGAPQHETATNPTCANGHDGIIRMNPGGGTPPYTYTWSPNVGATATISNLTAGTYNVTVTDANSCTRTNSIVLVCSNRLEEPNENTSTITTEFNVYPNPADAMVTIAFTLAKESSYSLKLIDMLGRIVQSETDNAVIGENTYIMNVEGIAKGIYIILLQQEGIISKSKLVVE